MKISIPTAVVLLSACVFYTCQTDSNPKVSTVAATEKTDPTAKPEVFWHAVIVDKLRLREEPGLSANVLIQLNEGEIVEGNGEVSANSDEVELRGISIKAPYYRVTPLSNGKPTGWAFGGALVQVYAGPRAGAPDRQRLSTLSDFLKGLNVKAVESGGQAWAFVEQHFGNATGPLADAVFILLEQFFRRMERDGAFYTLTESQTWSDADMTAIYEGKFDPASKPVTKTLAANGFRIVTAEGSVFPVVDCRKFLAFFRSKTTPPMLAYINQCTNEQNNPMFDDGGVIIPLEMVAEQAVFWEKFNRANPWFPLREETKASEKWMQLVLVNGADNTPVFDYESDEIDEEFKNVWDYILKKHPDTDLAKSVKQMVDLCTAEQWKRTQKVEAYREKVAKEHMEAN